MTRAFTLTFHIFKKEARKQIKYYDTQRVVIHTVDWIRVYAYLFKTFLLEDLNSTGHIPMMYRLYRPYMVAYHMVHMDVHSINQHILSLETLLLVHINN